MSVIALPAEDSTRGTHARLPDRFFQQRATGNRPRTLSPRKHAANRANAKKSTGPRTPAGKAKSSQNATTHALTSATIGNYKQDPTYATIRHELERELRPNSPTQRFLVEELALIVFKLDLLFPQAEHQLMNTPLGASEPATLPTPGKDDPSPDPRLAAPVIAAHLLQNQPTPLTRLWDYRRRLMSRYQSILRQLPKLKEQANQLQARDRQTEADREWDQKAREEWLAVYGPDAQARHRAQAQAALAAQTAITPTPTPPTKPQTPPAQNQPTAHPATPGPQTQNQKVSNPPSVSSVSSVPAVSSVSSMSSVAPLSSNPSTPPAQNEPTAPPLPPFPSESALAVVDQNFAPLIE